MSLPTPSPGRSGAYVPSSTARLHYAAHCISADPYSHHQVMTNSPRLHPAELPGLRQALVKVQSFALDALYWGVTTRQRMKCIPGVGVSDGAGTIEGLGEGETGAQKDDNVLLQRLDYFTGHGPSSDMQSQMYTAFSSFSFDEAVFGLGTAAVGLYIWKPRWAALHWPGPGRRGKDEYKDQPALVVDGSSFVDQFARSFAYIQAAGDHRHARNDHLRTHFRRPRRDCRHVWPVDGKPGEDTEDGKHPAQGAVTVSSSLLVLGDSLRTGAISPGEGDQCHAEQNGGVRDFDPTTRSSEAEGSQSRIGTQIPSHSSAVHATVSLRDPAIRRNALTLGNTLPVELLINVFSFLVHGLEAPIGLAIQQLAHYGKRFSKIYKSIEEYASRIVTIRLTMDPSRCASLFSRFSPSLPALRTMTLECTRTEPGRTSEPALRLDRRTSIAHTTTPALRILKITNLSLPWTLPMFRNLTVLQVDGDESFIEPTLSTLCNVLAACPDLESLKLINAGPVSLLGLDVEPVSLPKLRGLTIRCRESSLLPLNVLRMTSILSHLLSRLSLPPSADMHVTLFKPTTALHDLLLLQYNTLRLRYQEIILTTGDSHDGALHVNVGSEFAPLSARAYRFALFNLPNVSTIVINSAQAWFWEDKLPNSMEMDWHRLEEVRTEGLSLSMAVKLLRSGDISGLKKLEMADVPEWEAGEESLQELEKRANVFEVRYRGP
ncbi:hypothetical protein EVG20_g7492 [Dentipellis fragilis]|uniref:F-box domain-containing protein n=1 Tax=Dentipellis fragilis TaxID=205917 RepID=A0A4Y9YH21_9AGAM|nr:hypothetical protein EVG20_g7492 [Dentipellis fragilis]